MTSDQTLVSNYRSWLRCAVKWSRKGNPLMARHFYGMSQGIAVAIGAHRLYKPRRDLVLAILLKAETV